MSQNSPILEVRKLVTEFITEDETVRAVNGISFTLKQGEVIGIVGESGSGKSVTALSVMRLIPNPPGIIREGEIIYHHPEAGPVDLLQIDEREMRRYRGYRLAMIFQEPMTSLNPVYTNGDQVTEAIMLHQKVSFKEAKERAINLFKEVKLPRPESIFDSYPHELSGGQKQRVMIAMALSCNPSILIADEPTTALDVTVQKAILELMIELQEKHQMAIIFISHDLGVISEIANRVLVMYKGRIVEQGNITDIYLNPQHPYTKGLLACRPPLDKRLRVLPTVSDFMSMDDTGLMTEGPLTIDSVLNQFIVSSKERFERHVRLYKEQPLLQIKNLKTWFPIRKGIFGKIHNYVKAVDEVTFNVYPGETLGLVGESGCGKTTLGRTVLRLIDPMDGELIFNGRSFTFLPEKEVREFRKQMQIIFQDPYSSLNPRMRIGYAIMEPMQVHGIGANDKERKHRVIELLERVNMNESHFYRFPHEFSGGQRQRICIARALAVDPKFIICDEAVSSLDVSIQAQVLNLLNELKKEFNLTYIFISHDLSVVKFMSDRIVVMQNGLIVEIGDADEVYNNPKSEYTQQLIAAIPKGSRLKEKAAAVKK